MLKDRRDRGAYPARAAVVGKCDDAMGFKDDLQPAVGDAFRSNGAGDGLVALAVDARVVRALNKVGPVIPRAGKLAHDDGEREAGERYRDQ